MNGFYGNAEFGDIRLRKVEDQGVIIPENKNIKKNNINSVWLSDYKEINSFAPNTLFSNVYFDETLKENLDERFNKEGFYGGKGSESLSKTLSSIVSFYQFELERKDSKNYLFPEEISKVFEHKIGTFAFLGYAMLLLPESGADNICFVNNNPISKKDWDFVDNESTRLGIEFINEIAEGSIVQLKFRENTGGAIGQQSRTWSGGSVGQNATTAFGGSIGKNSFSGTGFSGGLLSSVLSDSLGYIYKHNFNLLPRTLGSVNLYNANGAAAGTNSTTIGSGGAIGFNTFSGGGGGSLGNEAFSFGGGSIGNNTFVLSGGAIGNEAIAGEGFSGGNESKTVLLKIENFNLESILWEIENNENDYDLIFINLSSFSEWENIKDLEYCPFGKIMIDDQYNYFIEITEKTENGIKIKIAKNIFTESLENVNLEVKFYKNYNSVAVGYQAEALVDNAVQLGTGKNEKEGSLQFKNYTIMTNDGAYVVSSNWYGTTLPETGNFEEGQLFFKI